MVGSRGRVSEYRAMRQRAVHARIMAQIDGEHRRGIPLPTAIQAKALSSILSNGVRQQRTTVEVLWRELDY